MRSCPTPPAGARSLDVEGFFRGQVFSRPDQGRPPGRARRRRDRPAPTDPRPASRFGPVTRSSADSARAPARSPSCWIAPAACANRSPAAPNGPPPRRPSPRSSRSPCRRARTSASGPSASSHPGTSSSMKRATIPTGVYTQEQLQPIRDLEKKPQDDHQMSASDGPVGPCPGRQRERDARPARAVLRHSPGRRDVEGGQYGPGQGRDPRLEEPARAHRR